MIGFIAKPHTRQDLIQAVAETLGRIDTAPQTPPAATKQDPIATILDMVDSDKALAADILNEHLERTPSIVRSLDSALESKDFNQIAHQAHTLKGSLLTLGFLDAGNCARELETHAKVGQIKACGELVSELHRQLKSVEGTITKYLASVEGPN